MRRALLTIAAALFVASGQADDFTYVDGTKHDNVTVSRIEPDGLVVTTDSGIIKLPFEKLSADVQKEYGYDPAKAEAFAQAIRFETRRQHFAKLNAVLDRLAARQADKLGLGGVEVHGFVLHTFKGDAPVEGALLDTREFSLRGDGKADIRIPTTIFIEGLTNLADREVFHGTIYPTGRVLREEASSYRAYAISTSIAHGRIQEKGEKTVEQVINEDRERWETRGTLTAAE